MHHFADHLAPHLLTVALLDQLQWCLARAESLQPRRARKVLQAVCHLGGNALFGYLDAHAALERAGCQVRKLDERANPQYRVEFAEAAPPLVCFSKKYGDEPNPDRDFAAVMTCSAADQSCPIVAGAKLRVAIAYDDPKLADGTPEETARYDERCRQIAREMLFVFSQIDN